MSLYIMLLIMLGTGILGGVVNYLLPDNNPTKKEYVKPLTNCIFLGLGATLLVPLFLELAQSKLMDNIKFDFKLQSSSTINIDSVNKSATEIMNKKGISDSLKLENLNSFLKNNKAIVNDVSNNQGKNYLLWCAYCLLAAAAGFKFINMLISGVFKANKIEELETDKAKLEQEKEKRIKNAQKSQEQEVESLITNTEVNELESDTTNTSLNNEPLILSLMPVTNQEDPQKGRFGGKNISNDRVLTATVDETEDEDFFIIELFVKSEDEKKPLNDEVIFFLHDSFSPSIRKIKPNNGIAKIENLYAYGAFTVGAITDNGKTKLELDLSQNTKFPKRFRER